MYLEKRGDDLSSILERIDFPQEFMRDPSYWIEADQLEGLLQLFVESFPSQSDCLVCDVASEVPNIKSWGALDIVLRMMPRPQEILFQPEKFLGYFISPLPRISGLKKMETSIEFQIQNFEKKYPLSMKFLVKAFSMLPCFGGRESALCTWENDVLSLKWDQASMVLNTVDAQLGHQLAPDFLNSVIQQLESNQRELEKRNQDLVSRNKEIEDAHRDLQATLKIQVYQEKMRSLSEFAEVISKDLHQPADSLAHQFLRMQDFMVRAQQVITVMKGTYNHPQVTEVLKRVDWDKAKDAFQDSLKVGESALEQIRHLSSELKKGSQITKEVEVKRRRVVEKNQHQVEIEF